LHGRIASKRGVVEDTRSMGKMLPDRQAFVAEVLSETRQSTTNRHWRALKRGRAAYRDLPFAGGSVTVADLFGMTFARTPSPEVHPHVIRSRGARPGHRTGQDLAGDVRRGGRRPSDHGDEPWAHGDGADVLDDAVVTGLPGLSDLG